MLQRLLILYVLIIVLASCIKDPPTITENTPPADSTTGNDTTTTNLPPVEIQTKVLVDHLTFPWELFWGPDNKIWFTERGGRISKADPETGAVTSLITISDVFSLSESGLLGMVMPHDITNNPYLFTAYNYK